MAVKLKSDLSKTLASATQRLDRKTMPHAKRPYWLRLAKGIYIGYRTSKRGAGTWNKRVNGALSLIAQADDHTHDEANGVEVMSFEQACQAALKDERTEAPKGCTLEHALTVAYPKHLKSEGKFAWNATGIYNHIKRVMPAMLERDVNEPSEQDWIDLREALLNGGVSIPNWNRQRKNLCACLNLNLVAKTSKHIWKPHLKRVSDGRDDDEIANNVVITEAQVLRWVAASYEDSYGLGLLIDVLATTGARSSQAVRLKVKHLLAKLDRLEMPKSGKGGGDPAERKRKTYPVYIPASLTRRLLEAAKGRKPEEPLLLRDDGRGWAESGYVYSLFFKAVKATLERIGLTVNDDGDEVSAYALRHTNITRQLQGNPDADGNPRQMPLPTLMVAKAHDTSVVMIEDHYAAKINHHAEKMIRATLLDHGTVIPMARTA